MIDPDALSILGARKLRTIAVVLYGTLGLLFATMPEAISSRLDDLPSSAFVRLAQTGVGRVTMLSNDLGVAPVYRAMRARFLAASGLAQP